MRYSAVGAGVIYGFTHRLSLQSAAAKEEAAAKFAKTEKLIAEAKEAFAKKNEKPAASATEIDLNDKNLDFAKVILGAVEGLK